MEILDYKKKPTELLVEYEDAIGGIHKEAIPVEKIEEWANVEDVLSGVKDSVDYDGSHKQEVYELDFVDYYDIEFSEQDIIDFIKWHNGITGL